MNRKKKLHSILRKREKRANAKLAPEANAKPRYVSKAERERIEAEENSIAIKSSET